MTCGLAKSELDILFYLYNKRSLSEKSSRSEKAIERDLGEKMDVEAALKRLLNGSFVGRKKKQAHNYWANAGVAIRTLKEHGYPIAFGGQRRL